MHIELTVSASAPGRCGIIGNPSDIYGGKVLSCSVPERAVCTLRFGAEPRFPEDTRLWDAAIVRFPLASNPEVDWRTEVPRSSGLSGSTALIASTIACVLKAQDKAPDLESATGLIAFAELVRDIERNEAQVVCGYQDAYMIVHGGLQLMNFAGKHPVNPGPPGSLKRLSGPLPFLLVTTGVERLSGAVHGPMAQRWMNGERAVVDAIARISDLAEPGADDLLAGDYGHLASLMEENQRLIAGVGGSGEAIDLLISKCKQHGAMATKLAGAGLGGTVIALTEDPDALEKDLRTEGYTRFMRPRAVEGVRYEP